MRRGKHVVAPIDTTICRDWQHKGFYIRSIKELSLPLHTRKRDVMAQGARLAAVARDVTAADMPSDSCKITPRNFNYFALVTG